MSLLEDSSYGERSEGVESLKLLERSLRGLVP
jgi:hypothetical protein